MVYKLIETGEMGPFTKDGSYYDIYEAINVMTPQGLNYGWDHFNSLDEAAMAYGVTRVPEPEEPSEEVNAPESIEDIIQEMIQEEVNN